MKRKTIMVAMDYGAMRQVAAVVHGDWAAHESLNHFDAWTITFVPSGLNVANLECPTERDAIAACAYLDAHKIGESLPRELLFKDDPWLRWPLPSARDMRGLIRAVEIAMGRR